MDSASLVPLTSRVVIVVLTALIALLLWLRQRDRHVATQFRTSVGRTDPMTGLPNRAAFETALAAKAAHCDRHGGSFTVLYLGLDGLRALNETHGHAGGDAVLREVAHRLQVACPQAHAARLHGDEFGLLLEGDIDASRSTAQRLLEVVKRPCRPPGPNAAAARAAPVQLAASSASIGLAVFPHHGTGVNLLANAELAMRAVKAAGGDGHADYEISMGDDHRQRIQLRADLVAAVEKRQFELYYQPKVDGRTLQITGAEALLRWNHPKRGMVSPAVFIPLAEKLGLIGGIGNWVIEEACRQASEWRRDGLRMRVAVNLSGFQLRQDDLVDRIVDALNRHGLQPTRFTCEITESVATEDTEVTRRLFARMRASGLRVAIDDFGTGYSSLAVLRRIPAEELKIDRTFVHDLPTSDSARSIASAIVQMAHSLDLQVVAEGVETEQQRDALAELGCDQMQGFLFGRPMTAKLLALWAAGDAPEHAQSFSASLFSTTDASML